MKPVHDQLAARPAGPGFIYELGLLALFAAGITFSAWLVLPIWDDGSTWQMMVDYGGQIRKSYGDRPAIGVIWQSFADTGFFWQLVTILHWLVWLGMALVTRQLWITLLPDYRAFALSAACLSLAPIVGQTQLVLINPVLASQLGPVMMYVAMLLLLRQASSTSMPFKLCAHALVVVLIVLCGLISEYALASVIACTALMTMLWFRKDDRRPHFLSIALYFFGGVATYIVYASSFSLRQNIRPEALMATENHVWRMLQALGRLVTTVWQTSLGALLEAVGSVEVGSTFFVVSMVVGLVAAGLVSLASRKELTSLSSEKTSMFSLLLTIGLVVSLALTIAPVLIMGRTFVGNFQTRTLLPLLPVASCASLYLLLTLLRQRFWFAVPALCGLLVGYGNAAQAIHAAEERQRVSAWGEEIRQYVLDEGMTVAIFEIPPRRTVPFNQGWICTFSNNEFTARLAADWPQDLRKRFWAFGSWESTRSKKGGRESSALRGVSLDRTTDRPFINRRMRGSVRHGEIKRILWLHVDRNDLTLTIDVRDV